MSSSDNSRSTTRLHEYDNSVPLTLDDLKTRCKSLIPVKYTYAEYIRQRNNSYSRTSNLVESLIKSRGLNEEFAYLFRKIYKDCLLRVVPISHKYLGDELMVDMLLNNIDPKYTQDEVIRNFVIEVLNGLFVSNLRRHRRCRLPDLIQKYDPCSHKNAWRKYDNAINPKFDHISGQYYPRRSEHSNYQDECYPDKGCNGEVAKKFTANLRNGLYKDDRKLLSLISLLRRIMDGEYPENISLSKYLSNEINSMLSVVHNIRESLSELSRSNPKVTCEISGTGNHGTIGSWGDSNPIKYEIVTHVQRKLIMFGYQCLLELNQHAPVVHVKGFYSRHDDELDNHNYDDDAYFDYTKFTGGENLIMTIVY